MNCCSFNSSPYNPSDPILVGSEVAFKLKGQRGASDEWIQCEVTRIYGDGTKYVMGEYILNGVLSLIFCRLQV